jgi:hypothetical protein
VDLCNIGQGIALRQRTTDYSNGIMRQTKGGLVRPPPVRRRCV